MSDASTNWKPWKMDSLVAADSPLPTQNPSDAMEVQFRQETELQIIRQQAHDEGFEAGFNKGVKSGHEEGYAKGYDSGEQAARDQIFKEHAEKMAPLNDMARHFSASLAQLDSAIAQQLSDIALSMGAALARRQLDITPEAIVDLVTEILRSEQDNLSHPTLWLHPDDALLVSEHLSDNLSSVGWTIRTDENITRGGCKVISKTGEINAEFETRVKSMIKELLP